MEIVYLSLGLVILPEFVLLSKGGSVNLVLPITGYENGEACYVLRIITFKVVFAELMNAFSFLSARYRAR